MTKLLVECVRELAALEPVREKWNALLDESETKTVELTYEWQITYWQHFNENAELFVLIIREANDIVAIAPLKLVTTHVLGLKIRCLELIAASESNYQDLLIGKNTNDILESVFDYFLSVQHTWDMLSLWHIPEESSTAHFFLGEFSQYPFRKIAGIDKCVFLQTETGLEEYKKGMTRHRRHRMTNYLNRITREVGQVQLRICTNETQFRTDLEKFFELHRQRWDQTETPSQFRNDRFCKFYSSAGSQLFSHGQLNLAVLDAGEVILALLLFFTFGKTSLIQLIASDPAYFPYSPVLVLQELFVEKSLSNGITVIDWGTYYSWKELCTNQTKNRVNLKIYPKRNFSNLIYLFSKLYEALRSSVPHDSFIMNYARFLRGKVRLLNEYFHRSAA